MTEQISPQKSIFKDLILPILVWTGVIFVFLNVRHLPFELSDKDGIVLRYAVKVIMTILIPLGVIHLLYKNKSDFGLNFPKYSDSIKLTLRSYAIVGPAGITFLLIGMLGLGFADWGGSLILSAVYLVVFYLIPKLTRSLPTRDHIIDSNKGITAFTFLSLATVAIAYFTYEQVPAISKILYYMFIVGLGEELLCRGYMQSAFNRYFGRPFKIGDVSYGWGLILAAVLFGLIHALVTVPPTWPWALFTFALGLTFGFIREKDGTILAPVLLHGLSDMPLVLFSV